MLVRLPNVVSVAFALVACASNTSPKGEQLDRPRPSSYDPPPPASPDPSLTADDAAALLPEIANTVASFDPALLRSAYQAFFALKDGNCPSATTATSSQGTNVLWAGADCTAASGARFSGVADVRIDDYSEQGGGKTKFFSITGDNMKITAADGKFLRIGGYFQIASTDGANDRSVIVLWPADVLADAATAKNNPWLLGTLRGGLEVLLQQSGQSRAIRYAGGVGLGPHPKLSSFSFGDFAIDNNTCPLATGGSVALRDQSGGWHDARFGSDKGSDSVCGACGTLLFDSKTIGSFCAKEPPLTALLAWGTQEPKL